MVRYAMTGGEQNALIELRELAESRKLPYTSSIAARSGAYDLHAYLDMWNGFLALRNGRDEIHESP